jgi:pSer/pThr/pTyr-binding forkhead associated (FHA) protein
MLIVVGGDVKTTEIKLRLPAIVGRGKGSTITLLQPLVSRQHCELYEAGGRLWVRDLGSLNGTYVNNEKVTESELPPNELLTVGTVTFRAVYEPQSDSESPAPAEPIPQFLPSKAQQEDEQPTVRVDPPSDIIPVELAKEAEPLELEGEGVPSTPLFETEPAPSRPAPKPAAAPAKPVIPAAVTTDLPGTKTVPVSAPAPAPAPTPAPAAPAEEAEEDEDLNDFLKSLGKK